MIMKVNNIILVFFLMVPFFLFSCDGNKSSTPLTYEEMTITLQNELEISRPAEHVIFTREEIMNLFGEIPAGEVPIFYDENETPVTSQADDLDGNGEWDEMVLLHDFDASSSATFAVRYDAWEDLPDFPVRTNVRLGIKNESGEFEDVTYEKRPVDHTKAKPTITYQMEGPAWENDVIAFRTYFDPRNGFDIFGKQTEEMVMDKVGIEGNYHELQPWGMDVLKVNNSLGAGALALWHENKLHRLGATDSSKFQLITEGPVRSIFNMTYEGWQVGNEKIDVTHQISIYAGEYCYQSDVFLSGFEGEKVLSTGIVNIHSDSLIFTDHGDEYVSIATHDRQSFLEEYLGMGILVPKDQFIESAKAPDEGEGVTQTYYVTMYAQENTPVRYYFYAVWEIEDAKWIDADNFVALLENEALRRSNPIKILNEQMASEK